MNPSEHQFEFENLLTFIELHGFRDDWKRVQLSDHDYWRLQSMILTAPQKAPVIPGTGGLRKLRFSSSESNRGKRSSFRICYVYFAEFGIVLLVIAYGKNEKDNLSSAQKHEIRKLIQREQELFSKGKYH